MSKADSDKQGDTDVLRAQDVVPPYSENTRSSENIASPLTEKKADRASDVPAEASDAEQKGDKIPKFDLAEQILAEQRKITATRRKAPSKSGLIRDSEDKGSNGADMIRAGLRRALSSGVAGPGKRAQTQNRESEVESIGYTVQPPPVLAEQERIIAEIVARDIEQLCGRFDA